MTINLLTFGLSMVIHLIKGDDNSLFFYFSVFLIEEMSKLHYQFVHQDEIRRLESLTSKNDFTDLDD